MKKHGQTSRKGSTPVYYTWLGMKARCLAKTHKAYPNYGGRGITICDKWLEFIGFYEDMGDRPNGHTLDRINVDGNYEKSNCRWATKIVQQMNMVERINKTSIHKGVCWKSDRKKWKAYISVKRKQIHLGYFDDENDAALAYNKKALELYGDYVYLNKVGNLE